ncbi:MAG TPA: DNA polymerase I, partial [Planctomycetaceae bacterium]|nr:DNA polymerase I [Planctomycetaceae bacterium]
EFPWEHERTRHVNVPRLQELFREFGFRKLIDDVRGLGPSTPSKTVVAPSKSKTRSLFDDDEREGEAPAEPRSVNSPHEEEGSAGALASPKVERIWELIDLPEKFTAFVAELREQKRICLDLETTSLDPRRAKIVGWAFCWQPGRAFYLPVQGPPGSVLLDPQAVVDALKPILETPELELVNQNVKYDLIVLRGVCIHPQNLGVDPMVGDYLLDAGARSHSLDTLLEKYLHRTGISITELIGTGKNQKSMEEIDVTRVGEYASEDADCALQIADIIAGELREQNLWDLYWNLERPLIPVLAEMEYNGIRVDADELAQQSVELTAELERLVGEIHTLAGHSFNIDSPIQLRTVLFDELGLPVKKRTKTGPSTDQDVLEELASLHPLPAKIIEHRQASKLKGTYVDALPLQIHPETGRIHCSFNQVVAATGRLSSNDPNLQNIPIRTQAGRRVRKAFVPAEPEWKLISADYSQIELRMLAHFSHDNVLLDAFEQGVDIHTAVASSVYGVEREFVTSDMRRVAKAVNFGVIYGQSPYGLAAAINIPQDDAAKFIDDYFAKYAGVTQFLEEVLDECLRTGYAKTILGRRRRIEGIRPDRNRNRNLAERTAINTVIQGSAADLIKQAMINVFHRMKTENHPGRMLLQIHDELVFEAPEDAVPSLVRLVREEMEGAMKLEVPLAVDVSAGENWLETEPYG